MNEELYVDEPCVVSFSISEMGWMLQFWQSYLRYLKHEVYPDHKFIVMTNIQYHPIIQDFVSYTIDLPKEFYELNLETDCYESPLPGSPPGSLTPPEVWKFLIDYLRKHYNVDKAVEIWTPRGYSKVIANKPQTFVKYSSTETFNFNKPIITIFPRARTRAANRNVPEFVWREVVDKLKDTFMIVLSGTPSGACLGDYNHENVINLIQYSGEDKLERTMDYLCNSVVSISSQSGPTHLSLLCDIPSYIIGHEKQRHTVTENRFSTPTSFRYVADYRAIDATTILSDVRDFMRLLKEHSVLPKKDHSFDAVLAEGVNDFKKILKERSENEY
jgi:hypothetical protein